MIDPLILLWGTGSFFAAFAIHVIIWRLQKPRREMVWLLGIFLLLPFLTYVILFIYSLKATGHIHFLSRPSYLVFTLIWHSAFSCAYIMTYPPIQAGCPSLRIMLAVNSSMPEGLTLREIDDLFSEEILFTQRLDDLKDDGLISLEYDTWGITKLGRLLAVFFLTYRRLLKLPVGEG